MSFINWGEPVFVPRRSGKSREIMNQINEVLKGSREEN